MRILGQRGLVAEATGELRADGQARRAPDERGGYGGLPGGVGDIGERRELGQATRPLQWSLAGTGDFLATNQLGRGRGLEQGEFVQVPHAHDEARLRLLEGGLHDVLPGHGAELRLRLPQLDVEWSCRPPTV